MSISSARRRELLSDTGIGRAILRDEKAAAPNSQPFAMTSDDPFRFDPEAELGPAAPGDNQKRQYDYRKSFDASWGCRLALQDILESPGVPDDLNRFLDRLRPADGSTKREGDLRNTLFNRLRDRLGTGYVDKKKSAEAVHDEIAKLVKESPPTPLSSLQQLIDKMK